MRNNNHDKIWDVAVIGGGPSGMMAAGRSAERGKSVILLEKNSELGKKLLITGGGRCNITNAEFDTKIFLSKFGDNAKFLFSPFSKFSPKDTFTFFEGKNLKLKIEAEKRAFPEDDKASSVWGVLLDYMEKHKVWVARDKEVKEIIVKDGLVEALRLKDNSLIKAKSFILATGGKSRPETGSTGDGFIWLSKMGHNVIQQEASLVPVAVKEKWVKDLSGVTLSDIKLNIFQNNKKIATKRGRILFTHFGVSGPMILNSSKLIGDLLKTGEVLLSIDLFPDLNISDLDKKVLEVMELNKNKHFKNILSNLIPSSLVPILIKTSKIKEDVLVNNLLKEDRLFFIKTLKNLPITASHLLGKDKAIITSGGVDLKEVNWKTMQSKKIANLYLIGDVLNIDRPSGGYSLQLCWTTGFIAGDNVL